MKDRDINEEIWSIDRIVHSPARLMILSCLSVVTSADFTFLLNQSGLTRGNLSANLAKLEEAGYVQITKEFVDKVPRTLIRLTAAGRRAVKNYSEQMQRIIGGLETGK